MPSGKMEFSDIYQDPFNEAKKPKGCFVTPLKALGIVLGAALIATAVGLIVYYKHPDYGKGSETATTPTIDVTTQTGDDGIITDIKLPGDLHPYHYDLRLRADFYGHQPENFTFSGAVKIFFTVKEGENPSQVVLHKKDMNPSEGKKLVVDEDSINLHCVTCSTRNLIAHDSVEEDTDREFFKVILPQGESLTAGQNYSLEMSFVGDLIDDLHGWYYSSYTDADTTSYLVTTQLQATDARRVFPCFDEPSMKATFTTTIERPEDLTSWSNTNITSEEELEDGWVADHYEKTPVMSTYLLAFVVADFECKDSDTDTGVLVQICARPNAIDQADFASSIAAPIQDYFEQYHNYSYPLSKTVHMAVPDFAAGAMENWGLILYRETALLYEEGVSSSAYKQRVAVVIAHELAHMWFGNLVTPTWWDDIWLNEGFASFMEYLGVDSQFGADNPDDDWKMDDQFLAADIHRVFPLDSLTSSHPVYAQVDHPDQISELFDTITYSKGASVIRMMRYFLGENGLGEDVFEKGMADYLAANAFSATNHTDLFEFLTKKKAEDTPGEDQIDVGEVMNTWILQMGYPVVHYSFDVSTGMLYVNQSHFLLDPSQRDSLPESPYNYIWEIPITLIREDYEPGPGPDDSWWNPTIYWLNTEEASISTLEAAPAAMANQWTIGNVQQRFYYRVNYDDTNWQFLIDFLADDDHEDIHPKNRAQIIDDLFNLGRAGYVQQTRALDVCSYMWKERDYVPWTALNRNIEYFNQILAFNIANGYLQVCMQDIIERPYNWAMSTTDDKHITKLTKVVIQSLACEFGLEVCQTDASDTYANWMTSGPNIDPDLRQVTYCTAIRNGGWDEWQWALDQYELSNSGSEQITLLRAMACSQEMWILNGYLEMTLAEDDKIKLQDVSTVLREVAKNPSGRILAWNFFREHWTQIFQWFGTSSFTLTSIITDITQYFSTQFELDQLEAFIAATPEQGSGTRAFQQAVDRTKSNMAWRDRNEEDVTNWLENYIDDLSTVTP